MKASIVGLMIFLVLIIFWEIYSGFSKKLLSKDLKRIKESGLQVNRSLFHFIELLVAFLLSIFLLFLQFLFIWDIHLAVYPNALTFSAIMNTPPQGLSGYENIRILLIVISSFISSISISMVLLNLIEFSFPPLLKLSEKETGLTFWEAMPGLVGFTLFALPLCLFFQLWATIF